MVNKNVFPFVGMVMVVMSQSGGMVINKAAMSDGMNKYVMLLYSYFISTFLLLPFPILHYFRSDEGTTTLTFSSLWSFFLLGLIGCSGQILSYVGIELSSPTLASAMLNLIPAFTFLLALIFRMEEACWRDLRTQAKVLGTAVSIGGAFVVIFFKGPAILNNTQSTTLSLQFSQQVNWILGGFFCACDSFLGALWYIYQTSIAKKCPELMVMVFFQSLFSTLECALFALFAVRDAEAWLLKLHTGWLAMLYQGIGANVIRFILLTWCVRRAGPLFCSMFKPVGIIFTVFMGAIFLGDHFYLGSLVGAVIIVAGFYVVMWGKAAQEDKIDIHYLESASCNNNVPLLQKNTA
ncbi:WAT1-related protein At5g40240-like isoform X1 [Arachis stenosperma]|uniref:WAT1-related protein At5g40240-like isoform X1 n=1 Tax=Arachis stenosperma TaxID=217475 RepID=UPI0025ACEA29|nr:WAT1-related protein At5g40240-like isoform X1 [Arachis stenosperma]